MQSKINNIEQSWQKVVWRFPLCLVILSAQLRPDGAVWLHVCVSMNKFGALGTAGALNSPFMVRWTTSKPADRVPVGTDKSSQQKEPSADFHKAQVKQKAFFFFF